MTRDADREAGPPLQTVRGLRYYLEGFPAGARTPALIRGVVVRKWARGNLSGRWVLELTGRINVIVGRKDSDVDISAMHVGRRVVVAGAARLSEQGHLVLEPERVDIVPHDSLLRKEGLAVADGPNVPAHVVTSFLLARLRSIVSASASRLGYRQFEPRYLSIPLEDRTAEPLNVIFEGWGSPISLAVSPAAQLLQILLETGEQQVFAVGRCFTSAYRDGFSSAEELVLVARQINTSMETAAEFATAVLQDLFNEGDTAIGRVAWSAESWPLVLVTDFSPRCVELPCIEWMSVDSPTPEKVIEVFRVLYPPGVAVAEGDVVEWSTNVRIGGVTLHLERLVSLLSPSRLAEIRYLGDPRRGTP